MSSGVLLGLALALVSASALNWGYFAQHGVASQLPTLSVRRPLRSLGLLFGARRWLAGFAVGLGGWAFYVAALALAPLSLVQATSAGGIGILALLVSRAGGARLTRREWIAVGISIGGLALLAASLAGQKLHSNAGGRFGTLAWLAASLLAAGIAVGPLAWRLAGGAGLGLAAGILYAAGDVATKAAVGGDARLVFVPALLVCHGLAFLALQLGFQRGGALATAGLATLCTNALPVLAGTVIFGETVPDGATGALRVLAFASVVIGAALLAATRTSAVNPSAPRLAGAGTSAYH